MATERIRFTKTARVGRVTEAGPADDSAKLADAEARIKRGDFIGASKVLRAMVSGRNIGTLPPDIMKRLRAAADAVNAESDRIGAENKKAAADRRRSAAEMAGDGYEYDAVGVYSGSIYSLAGGAELPMSFHPKDRVYLGYELRRRRLGGRWETVKTTRNYDEAKAWAAKSGHSLKPNPQ